MASLPEFISAGMDFFTGKTVLASTLEAATSKLETANARIAELEKIDAKALTDRIATLESDIKAKDEAISGHLTTIKTLEESFQTASRQAQQQIAKVGAQAPVKTEAPKNPETKDETHPFVASVRAKVKEGSTLGAAILYSANKSPSDHKAWLAAGQPSLIS